MTELLALDDIRVAFDGFTVLDQLNLHVEEGELRFLIGPNGAGKTTLMDLISGKVRPVSGNAPSTTARSTSRSRASTCWCGMGIGRKFQTPAIYRSLTCSSIWRSPSASERRCRRCSARLGSSEKERIWDALDTVGLKERAKEKAGALSHGEQQWLEIAMLLVQDPKLLLLDEPVAGMTRHERDKTGELLHALAGQHTILVTEHDMDFVRSSRARSRCCTWARC